MFQSSPARKGGCYFLRDHGPDDGGRVSILTRPKGRVLPPLRPQEGSGHRGVSILTRPKGRVLRCRRRLVPVSHNQFQSSPARKGGCYCPADRHLVRRVDVSILTRPKGRVLLGHGAHAGKELSQVSILTRPKGRVLPPGAPGASRPDRAVSILTRPKGRVLRCRTW